MNFFALRKDKYFFFGRVIFQRTLQGVFTQQNDLSQLKYYSNFLNSKSALV